MFIDRRYQEGDQESLFRDIPPSDMEFETGFGESLAASARLAFREGPLQMVLDEGELDDLGPDDSPKLPKKHWSNLALKEGVDLSNIPLEDLNENQYNFLIQRAKKRQADMEILSFNPYGHVANIPGGIAGGLAGDPLTTIGSALVGNALTGTPWGAIFGVAKTGTRAAMNAMRIAKAARAARGVLQNGGRIGKLADGAISLASGAAKGVGQVALSPQARMAYLVAGEGFMMENVAIHSEKILRESFGEEMSEDEIKDRLLLSPAMGVGLEGLKWGFRHLTGRIAKRINDGDTNIREEGIIDDIADGKEDYKLLKGPEELKLLAPPPSRGKGPTPPEGPIRQAGEARKMLPWKPTAERISLEKAYRKTHGGKAAKSIIRRSLRAPIVEGVPRPVGDIKVDLSEVSSSGDVIDLMPAQWRELSPRELAYTQKEVARIVADKAKAQIIDQTSDMRSPTERVAILSMLEKMDAMEKEMGLADVEDMGKTAKEFLDSKSLIKEQESNPIIKELEDIEARLKDDALDDAERQKLASDRDTILTALDEEEVSRLVDNDPRVQRLEDLYDEKRSTYDEDLIDEIEFEQEKILREMQEGLLDRLDLGRGADPNIVKAMAIEDMSNKSLDIMAEGDDPVNFIMVDDQGAEVRWDGKDVDSPVEPTPLQKELLEFSENATAADFIQAYDEGRIKSPEVREMARELKEYGEDFYDYDAAQRYIDSEKALDAEAMGIADQIPGMARGAAEVRKKFRPEEEAKHLDDIAREKLMEGEDPRDDILRSIKNINSSRASSVLQGDSIQKRRMQEAFRKLDDMEPEKVINRIDELDTEIKEFNARRLVESLRIDGDMNDVHKGFIQSSRIGIPPQPGPRSKMKKSQWQLLKDQSVQLIRQHIIDGNAVITGIGKFKGRRIIYAAPDGTVYFAKKGRAGVATDALEKGYIDLETINAVYVHPKRRSNFESALIDKAAPAPKRVVNKYTKDKVREMWKKQEGLTEKAHKYAESLHGDLKTKEGSDAAMAAMGDHFGDVIKDSKKRQEMKEQLERFRELKDETADSIISCTLKP